MELTGVTGALTDGVLSPVQQRELDRRQSQSAARVRKHWREHGHGKPYPMVALPTGIGKSRIAHLLMRGSKTKKILLIVGTKNILLEQNGQYLQELVELETGEATWNVLPTTDSKVVLTTWQGLGRYLAKDRERPVFDLVIVDEAHNMGTERRISLLETLKPKAVLGMTATSYRSSGRIRAPEEYGFKIVDSMSLPDCMDKRWLSPMLGLCLDTQIVLPADVLKGQILSESKLNRELRKHPQIFNVIAKEVAKRFLPSGMKTVLVVNRVEEACTVARELTELGFKVGLAVNQSAARQLSSEFVTLDAIERYQLPHSYESSIQVLISPQVIGEGFNAPATECVIWAAPTMSSLRYTQVMGRGARRCQGKKYCLVVDFVY